MAEVSREIILAAMQGDEEAFGVIVETFQTPVYNLCFRMLYNEGAAEEAAQETFWKAWSNIKTYDVNRSFGSWLLSIAAHYCIDQTRKKSVPQVEIDETMEEVIPENTPLPEHEVMAREREALIQRLLSQLNETDRAAIIMRYWHEMSDREIADNLGLSESAVKSRLFRARKQFAKLWEGSEETDGEY